MLWLGWWSSMALLFFLPRMVSPLEGVKKAEKISNPKITFFFLEDFQDDFSLPPQSTKLAMLIPWSDISFFDCPRLVEGFCMHHAQEQSSSFSKVQQFGFTCFWILRLFFTKFTEEEQFELLELWRASQKNAKKVKRGSLGQPVLFPRELCLGISWTSPTKKWELFWDPPKSSKIIGYLMRHTGMISCTARYTWSDVSMLRVYTDVSPNSGAWNPWVSSIESPFPSNLWGPKIWDIHLAFIKNQIDCKLGR